jgi:hypothetical protein
VGSIPIHPRHLVLPVTAKMTASVCTERRRWL